MKIPFFSSPKWPVLPLEEIQRRSKILIIDDEEFTYLGLFQRSGYTIEKWNDIDDLNKLENGFYDIILLDLQGVGKKYSKEQGLGILKHIHNVNPTQIIIAYSNSDYSLTYQEFFTMADSALAKTDEFYKFKRTVDELLQKKYSMEFYIQKVNGVLGEKYQTDIQFQKILKEALMKRRTDKVVMSRIEV